MSKRKSSQELRSHRWLGVNDLRAFGHRSRLRQGGFDAEEIGRIVERGQGNEPAFVVPLQDPELFEPADELEDGVLGPEAGQFAESHTGIGEQGDDIVVAMG